MARALTTALDGNATPPTARSAEFIAWWCGELAALWPRTRPSLPRGDIVVALYNGRTLQFAASGRGGIEQLGVVDCQPDSRGYDPNTELLASQIRQSNLPLVLRLAPDLGLMALDRLPQAASRELRQIVANRLDSLTPWNAETAVFDTLDISPAADGMIDVQLAVVPRRPIDRAIEQLAELGLAPDVVDLAIDEDDAEAVGPPTHDLGGAVRRPRLPKAIPIGAALILFTAFAGGVFAFFDLQSRQAALEQRQGYAAMLTERLQDLPTLRARIEMLEDEDRAALDRHLARPSALVTIETLSQVLPDSVWLESLTLSEGRLVLNGFSTDAAKLPLLLEGTAAFRDAAFTASNERLMMPTSDDEVIEVDRFTLQADVRPDAGLLP